MADFISAYAGVDKDRLGVLGICGGGGYTLNAAKSDKRFKAVATLKYVQFRTGKKERLYEQPAGYSSGTSAAGF